MKFKKHESGRSMVEMLGVLAIIGVLSVGGIAGYSLSMRRHRANGVADYAAKFALIAYNQCYRMVVDEGNSYFEDLEDCNSGIIQSYYADSDETPDIGSAPAGVSAVGLNRIESDDNGNDIVHIDAKFTDEKLCQAVGSISGTGCTSSSVIFKIKQN